MVTIPFLYSGSKDINRFHDLKNVTDLHDLHDLQNFQKFNSSFRCLYPALLTGSLSSDCRIAT